MATAEKTVLVVEDDGEVREVMAEHLALNGFAVVEAATGIEAFMELERERPDALVLDLNMPRLGGVEALRRILAAHPALPVIALAEEADPEVHWQGLELGARDVLPTPVVLDDLVAALEGSEEWPPAPAPETPPAPQRSRQTDTPEVRVLVIGDDPELCGALEECLGERGFRAASARHDAAAVGAVAQAPPDIVLLDISVAGASELDALPTIRTLAPHATVIMLGEITDTEVARRGLARGAFDFLVKPPAPEALGESLEAALAMRRLAA
jgi:DNA-binding response OmpR family regulator